MRLHKRRIQATLMTISSRISHNIAQIQRFTFRSCLSRTVRLSTTILLKRVAAIILMAAFFLPLSQCSGTDSETGVTKVYVTYAYSADWPSVNPLTAAAAFTWPLALSIATLVWPRLNQKWPIGIIELVLCAGSALVLVVLIAFCDKVLYGTYVAGGSIGLYFTTTLVALGSRVRKKWGKHTLSAVLPDPRIE